MTRKQHRSAKIIIDVTLNAMRDRPPSDCERTDDNRMCDAREPGRFPALRRFAELTRSRRWDEQGFRVWQHAKNVVT